MPEEHAEKRSDRRIPGVWGLLRPSPGARMRAAGILAAANLLVLVGCSGSAAGRDGPPTASACDQWESASGVVWVTAVRIARWVSGP